MDTYAVRYIPLDRDLKVKRTTFRHPHFHSKVKSLMARNCKMGHWKSNIHNYNGGFYLAFFLAPGSRDGAVIRALASGDWRLPKTIKNKRTIYILLNLTFISLQFMLTIHTLFDCFIENFTSYIEARKNEITKEKPNTMSKHNVIYVDTVHLLYSSYMSALLIADSHVR